MRQLESFIGTPLASAIGWALLHSLWEGAIVAGVLAAVMVAIRSSRVRYFAAGVAMLVMVVGFSFTLFNLLPKAMDGFGASGSRILPAWHDVAESGVFRSSRPNFAAFVPWLAVFWITGVCVIYLRRLADCISVHRLRRRGVCSAPLRWQRELARLSVELRVSRSVLLMETCVAEVPLVLGHLRPMILMPIGLLAGLPPAQIEAILLHELAHIRRCDYLVNLLQRLVEGLLFYHPAIWWISRVMRAERENCCDDIAVSVSGDTQEYALALAALEQNRLKAYEAAIAATGGSLMKRVRRLLYPERPNGAWAPFLAAAILILIAAVSLAARQPRVPHQSSAGLQPQGVSQTVPQRPEPPQGGSPDSRKTSPVQANIQKHRDLEKEEVRTFYLPVTTTPQGLTEMATALRQILDLHYIQQLNTRNVIIIRDTPDKLALADQMIRDMDKAKEMELVISSPYSKWLNEEVVYIIDDAERAAFQGLRTDEERNRFVEDFWKRRNPSPGSLNNAFKEEHYRRIAYANEHFATGRPGWQTDRGHMYIVYGPPDEIKSEARGPGNSYALQIWTFRHIDGIGDNLSFTFVDRRGQGDFHLAPGNAL